jgi:hypothetical protein
MTIFGTRQNAPAMALVLGALLWSGSQAAADQVIPDDLIVQGSACVGIDCVNNEPFGFDTIILKENNLRIFFNDTSTIAGFPANKWRLIANDSAGGGANFFAIEDATAARQLLRISAGAPANSLFMDSGGRLGFGTSTPVLLLHARRSDTPALRFEQDASGGFSPQTWDIAGNEANFFIRDVTGGSRLPFRIRPGAPTSSLDIAATGFVGINTASPSERLHMFSAGATDNLLLRIENGTRAWSLGINGAADFFRITDQTAGQARLAISNVGNIGIGTTTPARQLHTTGTVRFAGIVNCAAGLVTNASGDLACLSSSRQFKIIAGDLAPNVALANIMALRPQTGAYKETPDVPEHWLVAEDVAAVDPALAGLKDGEPYVVKTQNIVADLVAVIQQQQRRIEALERALAK